MTTENPILLSHNILDCGKLTGPEVVGYELERMRDHYRHSWWQAPGTSTQQIFIRAKNLVTNSDFELGISGWALGVSGGGAGTLTHNAVGQIEGVADALLTATTADASTQICQVIHFKPLFFQAGRTYKMMFRGMVQDVSQKLVRFGFLAEGLIETVGNYDDVLVAPSVAAGFYFNFTPSADGWYHPYFRALEAQTLQFDEVVVSEARDIDTLIIDKGHTMLLATIRIQFRHQESGTWSYVTGASSIQWLNNAPVYITFDGVNAINFKIVITVLAVYGEIPVAKIPTMYIGERWSIDKSRVEFYDPHEEKRIEDSIVGDAGIQQRIHKYNQRIFKTTLLPFSLSDYDNIKKVYEDTDNGLKPFFFIPRPTSDINDILFMRFKGGRKAPYFAPDQQRKWKFDLEEVIGARNI